MLRILNSIHVSLKGRKTAAHIFYFVINFISTFSIVVHIIIFLLQVIIICVPLRKNDDTTQQSIQKASV